VLGLTTGEAPECDACGRPLQPERRRPGRRPTSRKFSPGAVAERRKKIARTPVTPPTV
jgi:hypothetical protein